jgi:hypothetical protein
LGDFPVASLRAEKHATGKSREPADKNVGATSIMDTAWGGCLAGKQ